MQSDITRGRSLIAVGAFQSFVAFVGTREQSQLQKFVYFNECLKVVVLNAVEDEANENCRQGARMVTKEKGKAGGRWDLGLREAWARRRQRIADNRRFWALVEPYRPPPRLLPLLLLNTAAFYTGLVAAAITEQLYKEKYWDEHPGAAVPMMHPLFYIGPYKVTREDFSEENAS